MWLRPAKGLQFCNMQMSFSPDLEYLQGSDNLAGPETPATFDFGKSMWGIRYGQCGTMGAMERR
jgi:hypothetical protein